MRCPCLLYLATAAWLASAPHFGAYVWHALAVLLFVPTLLFCCVPANQRCGCGMALLLFVLLEAAFALALVNAEWEAARCDRRTVANAAVYDAHIEAVRMTAKVAQITELKIFHEARWGSGQAATNPPPPELEMDALGRCAYPGASEVPHEVVGHRLAPSGEGRLLTMRPLGAAAGGGDTVECAAADLVALNRRFEAVWCRHG